MRRLRTLSLSVCAFAAGPALLASPGAAAAKTVLSADSINRATFAPLPNPAAKRPVPEIVKAEVLLDRARFSPGAIDGIDGDNFRKALGAYQVQMGLQASGRLDKPTWDKLTGADPAPILVQRTIMQADLKGPFIKKIPAKFEKQADLKALGYTSVQEELSEQYHTSVGLLEALNKGAGWKKPGTQIIVPQVVVDRSATKVSRVTVDKPAHAVRAYMADGRLAAYYPASIGSDEKPAPTGQFVIRRVIHNPDYTYNPKYAFKGVKSDKPFTIAPGPNNPVGSVWMDLSYEGYGIHGTPQPDLVGKTQSHGCIRLTNWDAEDLASMVAKGTAVEFLEASAPASAPAATVVPGLAPTPPAATPDPATPTPMVMPPAALPPAPPKP